MGHMKFERFTDLVQRTTGFHSFLDKYPKHVHFTSRCKTYPPLGNNCTLVTDPNDQCCQVPSCVNPNTNNPNQIVTGVVGTITGSSLPDNNPYTGGTRGKIKNFIHEV